MRSTAEQLEYDAQTLQIAFENINIDVLNEANRTSNRSSSTHYKQIN